MYPYEQPQLTTFSNLIETANPGFAVPLTLAMIRTLVPIAITPGSGQIQDTSVRIVMRPGQPYIGSETVTYRRVNLGNFFRDLQPIPLSTYTSGTTLSSTQLCTALNTLYGLALVPTDVTAATYAAGVSTVTVAATSLCYSGSFTINWVKGLQFIADVFAATAGAGVLVGKLYPGGNTFGSGRLPQGDVLTYGLDCTNIDGQLRRLAVSQTPVTGDWNTSGSDLAQILAFLQTNIPAVGFNSGQCTTTQGGLGGVTLTRFTLPSASVPGANSNLYTLVTTITAPAGSWFQGTMYLHYDVIGAPPRPFNTVALLHFDGVSGSATFKDECSNIWTPSAGAVLSNTQTAFGSSASFGATGAANQFISTPITQAMQFTGDFTVEFWHFLSSNVADAAPVAIGNNASNTTMAYIAYVAGDIFVKGDGQTAATKVSSVAFPLNTWLHIALVKHGTAWTVYRGGVASAPVTINAPWGTEGGLLYVNGFSSAVTAVNGFIDELRISNIARYLAGFTPPNAPFVVD